MGKREEYIRAKGPLAEDLYIMLLHLQSRSNVTYHYTLPNGYQPDLRKYFSWKYDQDWSACSKSCGKGIQRITPKCFETNEGFLDDSFCFQTPKPEDIIEVCNLNECEPE